MDVPQLIARYQGPLVGFLASLGHDGRTARELAQDTFAQAYLARDRFRGHWERGKEVAPWLLGIARKLHLAHRRQRRGMPLEALPPQAEPSTTAEDDPNDTSETVLRVLQSLPWEAREILMMRYSGEQSLAAIAELLGLSKRAVEGRLRRARQELEARLRERGIGAPAARSSS